MNGGAGSPAADLCCPRLDGDGRVPGSQAHGGGGGQVVMPTSLTVTGGELLGLALSLRARGLRGLDVLRRSQDRAPPGVDRPQRSSTHFRHAPLTDRWERAFSFLRRAHMSVTIPRAATDAAKWDS